MTDIGRKLEAARNRAASFGRLYGCKETADDFLKLKYAELYEDAVGDTVGERDAWVKRQPGYIEAVERKRDAYADYKAGETYLKCLFAEVEVWRSEQANNRWIDKVHT
jgi:hypothetical protein